MSGKTANEAKLSIRIDAELKERFDEALDELGTDFTNAVRMLASQIARSGTLPFDAAPTAFKACRTSKVVSVRLKDATLAKARTILDSIGIGFPTAVRMLALRTVEDRALPFRPGEQNPFPGRKKGAGYQGSLPETERTSCARAILDNSPGERLPAETASYLRYHGRGIEHPPLFAGNVGQWANDVAQSPTPKIPFVKTKTHLPR